MSRVAVLMGGWSAEREVSLVERRANAPRRSRDLGYDVAAIDVTRDLAGAARGADAAPDAVLQRAARPRRRGRHDPGRARDAAHSLYPFGRRSPRRSRWTSRRRSASSPPPACRCAESVVDEPAPSSPAAIRCRAPFVVKPINEGSSVGVRIVRCGDNAWADEARDWRYRRARSWSSAIVPGREITVAVMGDRALGRARDPAGAGSFYDYAAKYAPGGSRASDAGADPSPRPMRAALDIALARASRARLPRRQPRRSALRRHRGRAGPHGAARSQHPARHDADLAGARDRRACRHLLCRAGALDGGERGMRWLSAAPASAAPARASAGVARSSRLVDLSLPPCWSARLWPAQLDRLRRCGRSRCRHRASTPAADATAALRLSVANVRSSGAQRSRPRGDPRRARRRARHADPRGRPGRGQGAARSAALGPTAAIERLPARHDLRAPRRARAARVLAAPGQARPRSTATARSIPVRRARRVRRADRAGRGRRRAEPCRRRCSTMLASEPDARGRTSPRRCGSAAGAGTCGSTAASTSLLPSDDPAAAWHRLAALDRSERLLERDIAGGRSAPARPAGRPRHAGAAKGYPASQERTPDGEEANGGKST